jgi:(2R)-sulfolactate sulfo-lyase subunit alpha
MENGFLTHHEKDNVGVAVSDLKKGEEVGGVCLEDNSSLSKVEAVNDVPLGHKIALADISKGDGVIKYGVRIGSATKAIKTGEHVHIHNLKSDRW